MAFRVLIIDDMAIIRQPMAHTLKKSGYEVLEAQNGLEALEILKQEKVHVLLLDVAMPGMDGLTMLQQLRDMPGGADVHVILLTGMGDRVTVLRAAKLGVRDYMLKTAFSLEELLARVHRLAAPSTAAPVPEAIVAAPAAVPVTPIAGAAPAPAKVPFMPPAAPRTAGATNPDTATRAVSPPARKIAGSPALAQRMPPHVKLVLLTREQTHARLAQITGTRTCAGVVAQVMALANSPRSEISELVQVIETDPILASRVLQLANSTMFRQKSGRLSNIDDAVRNVGMRSIQNLVISIGVFESFPPNQADGFNTLRCWQHSFAVAAILRVMMAHRTEEEREHMALVGLCHDLGEIVLRQHFVAEFEDILRHAEQTGQTASAVEAVALSMRHGELVNEVLTRIGLPASIAMPIMRFHEGSANAPAESLQAIRLLQIANGLAHGMMLAPSTEALLTPIARADLKRACGNDQMEIDLQRLRNEVLTSTNALARLPSGDESRFMRPLIERAATAVWYARHAGYADLDPVGAALGMLGQVRIEGRLPQGGEELESTDVIIAVSPFAESPPVMLNELRALRKSQGYRGQPIIALLGNTGGVASSADLMVQALPVSLKSLAALIGAAVVSEPLLVG